MRIREEVETGIRLEPEVGFTKTFEPIPGSLAQKLPVFERFAKPTSTSALALEKYLRGSGDVLQLTEKARS